jgi:hypothetical protein
MIQKLALIAMLCTPLLAAAAGEEAPKRKADAPVATASKAKPAAARKVTTAASAASASAASAAHSNQQEQARAQSRGTSMGACQKKAADQNLAGVDKKQFIAACLTGQ